MCRAASPVGKFQCTLTASKGCSFVAFGVQWQLGLVLELVGAAVALGAAVKEEEIDKDPQATDWLLTELAYLHAVLCENPWRALVAARQEQLPAKHISTPADSFSFVPPPFWQTLALAGNRERTSCVHADPLSDHTDAGINCTHTRFAKVIPFVFTLLFN